MTWTARFAAFVAINRITKAIHRQLNFCKANVWYYRKSTRTWACKPWQIEQARMQKYAPSMRLGNQTSGDWSGSERKKCQSFVVDFLKYTVLFDCNTALKSLSSFTFFVGFTVRGMRKSTKIADLYSGNATLTKPGFFRQGRGEGFP